jgi:hypothetical protein
MPFETAGEIKEAVDGKEGDSAIVDMRDLMEQDYADGYTLEPFEPEKAGYESYTSSQPRNFFDKVLDGLNRSQLTIQVKVPEDSEEESRNAASDGELYLFGALTDIDRQLTAMLEPPLRQSLGFYECLRGWMAMRVLVYIPKDEREVVFDVQSWDPMHVTWEMGANGLIWAAHKRAASKTQIEDEYPNFELGNLKTAGIAGDDSSNGIEVIDFWTKDENAVVINGDFAKELTDHEIGHVPVFIGNVGSTPTIQDEMFQIQLKDRGNSVWSASRNLIEPRNRYISWVMDMAKRSVAGSLIYESDDGMRGVAGDPYEKFQVIKVKRGDKIYPLETLKAPPEMTGVLQIMQEDWQQSTLPYPLAYGGTKEAMSGRALSVLADATRSVYSPRSGALARAYTWLCEELLKQFAKNGKEVDLSGFDSRDDFFHVKVTPDKIDPAWFVNVTVEPRLPRDKEQEIQMAIMATQSSGDGLPLVSQRTAREEYLRLRDPDGEEDKILVEAGKKLPPVMAAQVAKALQDAGEPELAADVLALLESEPPGGPPAGPPGEPPQGPPPLPPELVEIIVGVLMQSGAADVAQALLEALGIDPAVLQAGGPPPQGPPPGPPAPPPGV